MFFQYPSDGSASPTWSALIQPRDQPEMSSLTKMRKAVNNQTVPSSPTIRYTKERLTTKFHSKKYIALRVRTYTRICAVSSLKHLLTGTICHCYLAKTVRALRSGAVNAYFAQALKIVLKIRHDYRIFWLLNFPRAANLDFSVD